MYIKICLHLLPYLGDSRCCLAAFSLPTLVVVLILVLDACNCLFVILICICSKTLLSGTVLTYLRLSTITSKCRFETENNYALLLFETHDSVHWSKKKLLCTWFHCVSLVCLLELNATVTTTNFMAVCFHRTMWFQWTTNALELAVCCPLWLLNSTQRYCARKGVL